MNAISRYGIVGAFLLLAGLTGCGNYTITFEVADVINARGGDASREMLDIDILCLTKAEVEKHPEIVQRTLRSDEWFQMRDAGSAKIGDIDPDHIYSLRSGEKSSRDTRVGDPLLSGRDRKDNKNTTSIRVHHSQYTNGDAALVIYGRFSGESGLAKVDPVVIQPPPGWNKEDEIIIKVDRNSMTCANCD